MGKSPINASQHDEYSSHNATLTVPVGPVPHRFNSVAQLRTERAADRGDLHLAVRPELATFQASDRKANMTAQISAALLNDRSTTAVDRNTLTNPVVTHGESSRRILPRYSTGASTPGLSMVQIKRSLDRSTNTSDQDLNAKKRNYR